MNFFKRKGFYAFASGCAFGGVFAIYISNVNIPVYSFTELVAVVLNFPFLVGMRIGDIILAPVCYFSTTNICRGLGFDGGPLEWVEWTSVIGGGILVYGLIFLAIYWLFDILKSKFTKKV